MGGGRVSQIQNQRPPRRVTSDPQAGAPVCSASRHTPPLPTIRPPGTQGAYFCHFLCCSPPAWAHFSQTRALGSGIWCFLPEESVPARSFKPPGPSGEPGVSGLPPPARLSLTSPVNRGFLSPRPRAISQEGRSPQASVEISVGPSCFLQPVAQSRIPLTG